MIRGVAFAALLSAACQRSSDPPELDDDARRLLQRMEDEERRRPPLSTDPLALRAVSPLRSRRLPLRGGISGELDGVAWTAVELLETTQVTDGKTTLTTPDLFVKLTLEASAATALEVDLSNATLTNGAQRAPLGRAAQRIGKGAPLVLALQAGRPEAVTLYFEAPPEMISAGLKFVLSRGESRVELTMQ